MYTVKGFANSFVYKFYFNKISSNVVLKSIFRWRCKYYSYYENDCGAYYIDDLAFFFVSDFIYIYFMYKWVWIIHVKSLTLDYLREITFFPPEKENVQFVILTRAHCYPMTDIFTFWTVIVVIIIQFFTHKSRLRKRPTEFPWTIAQVVYGYA